MSLIQCGLTNPIDWGLMTFMYFLADNYIKVYILIYGPSASGKTEIMRNVYSLFQGRYNLERYHEPSNEPFYNKYPYICSTTNYLSKQHIDFAKNRGYVVVILQSGLPLEKPAYYGIFFNRLTLEKYNPIQKTPLHIKLHEESIKIGKVFDVNIVSIITNKAGRYLKVEIQDLKDNLKDKLYITLDNNSVDIDTYPPLTEIPVTDTIKGVYGPTW